MNFCPPGAYPRRILQVMNIPELTRENVASHLQVHYYFKGDLKNVYYSKLNVCLQFLQKYRAYLRKVTTPASKITFGNANQLPTTEVTHPISTNIAPTSTQQFMPQNFNFPTAHYQMVDNIYPVSNSTGAFNNQSPIMVHILLLLTCS